jgi:transcriptional regulator with GAF, ATPase, and Fis domain
MRIVSAKNAEDDPKATIDVGSADLSGGKRGGGPTSSLKAVVLSGPEEGQEIPLDPKQTITLGADSSCNLVLTDRAVSRKHLSLTFDGLEVTVRDLGSRNGTSLAGAKIKEAILPIGAVLTVGQSAITVQPRWHVREVPPSSAKAFGEVLGESLAMREIFAILERVAPTDVTVLIEGESGTGKELIARSIHHASGRKDKPYVVFDCGAVPGELAESELFGHKRGAFSGAVADRAGAFAQADGGTICLDELGELPQELQPKLLRVLETGEVKPVGADKPRKVDVRVLAATNRDLYAEARRGSFRSDLLYRLEVVKIRVPPLRQRPDDIPLLVARLLDGKILGEGGVGGVGGVGGENLRKLVGYGWPGNVRELRNMLTRAVALATAPAKPAPRFADLVFNLGPVSSVPSTIGMEYPGVSSPVEYKEAKEQVLLSFHRAYVTALLDRHKGNIQRAASAAGLSRKHLYELVRRVEGETAPTAEEEELPE